MKKKAIKEARKRAEEDKKWQLKLVKSTLKEARKMVMDLNGTKWADDMAVVNLAFNMANIHIMHRNTLRQLKQAEDQMKMMMELVKNKPKQDCSKCAGPVKSA